MDNTKIMNSKWVCTDNDSLQYYKKIDDRRYIFIEKAWLNIIEDDPGYPNKEYTVKTAIVDLNDYTRKEYEIAISGYYDSLGELETLCIESENDLDQIIAECIFEEMNDGSATTYGVMTEEKANAFIEKYISK